MADKNGDDKGFVVKDRRMFDKGGEAREEEKTADTRAAKTAERSPSHTEEGAGNAQPDSEESYEFPEINFANFVMSLHTSALFHFGLFADPVSGETAKNLPAAQQTIEILDMLKIKTAGNLDDDELKLLEGVLYDLKMRFVKESGKS